jgi:NAD(P)-dependent dehydrogenase (short-subunit alcohol dehydrogenase family)
MRAAIVTGASRGIGRAVALSLGEMGYTVYVTGRTQTPGAIPGTVGQTAQEVTDAGGHGVAMACDHHDDDAVAAVFQRIASDGVELDLVVNNVFATASEVALGDLPFYDQPASAIDDMLSIGLRAHYLASWHGVQLMRARGRGLIVNVSSAGAVYSVVSPSYCMAKAGLDKFTVDAAKDLKPIGIAMVSLWPGPLVGTEFVQAHPPTNLGEITESPFVTGRAVAALTNDPDIMRYTGRVLVAADVVAAKGLTDIDGSTPAYPFDQDQIQRQLLRRSPLRLPTV